MSNVTDKIVQTEAAQPREKILIVDDEHDILMLVNFHLTRAGFEVVTATNGREAVEIANRENPSLVILDRMMPEMDGVEVCRQLRAGNPAMFILMLTALDTEEQKILGLEAGADDYVTKPFSGRELVARVRSMMRRNKFETEVQVAAVTTVPDELKSTDESGLTVDAERRQVWKRGEEVELTKLEFDLLKYLFNNPGLVFSRDQLLEQVWNYDYFGDGRVVDVHMARLRKKLEDDPANPRFIQTIRGVGYKYLV
jgi:DNA-binding response OmpR family regulator